jgi:hypothetical protein
MKNKLIPYIIIGILVIAGVVGASLYFVKKQSPPSPVEQQAPIATPPEAQEKVPSEKAPADGTANWKIYESQAMRFSIKYPPDWTMWPEEKMVPPADVYGWMSVKLAALKEEGHEEAVIYFQSGIPYEHVAPGGITQQIPIAKVISEARERKPLSEENITIGNRSAVKFTYILNGEHINPPLFSQEIYIPLNNNKLFEIIAQIEASKREVYEPIFNQILSTFRFLE